VRGTRAGTVEEIDVTAGVGMADGVEVRGALSPDDRLVVRGGERLMPGEAVTVTEPHLTAVTPGTSFTAVAAQ
jgi:hypothetical protein